VSQLEVGSRNIHTPVLDQRQEAKMPEMRKTSLSLPESLWRRARIRAAQEDRGVQDVVADALTLYLKTKPVNRSESAR
jgi:hypothetical protein